jgi:hypothetical protein
MVTSAPGRPVRREIANPPWDGCGRVATERTRPTRAGATRRQLAIPGPLRACVAAYNPRERGSSRLIRIGPGVGTLLVGETETR